jgi:hypothetical protein
MVMTDPIRCRVAACRESLDDGKQWSFYLINDSDAAFDSAELRTVSYEWGDMGTTMAVDVPIPGLAPGASVLIWRGDDDGAELRMDLSVRVRMAGREVQLLFEFPKLYRKTNLPLVGGVGKPGWQEAAEG